METPALARRRLAFLVALYAVAAVWGVRAGLLPRDRRDADFLLCVVAGVVSVLLLDADARLRCKPLPVGSRWLLLAVWPVALPIYAVATHKLRGLWIVGKHVALGYALFVISGMAARLIARQVSPGLPLPP